MSRRGFGPHIGMGGGGVCGQSVSAYMDALERVFLVEPQPAFVPAPDPRVRIAGTPMRRLADPSVAAAALGLSSGRLARDPGTLERLFGSLCVRDLRVYASVHHGRVSRYRDGKRRCLEAVVELPDGRFGAFGTSAGTGGVDDCADGLLRAARVFAGHSWREPSFLCVLCGTAPAPYRRPDGVCVVPVTCLRDRCQTLSVPSCSESPGHA